MRSSFSSPNADLLFDVQLLAIQRKAGGATLKMKQGQGGSGGGVAPAAMGGEQTPRASLLMYYCVVRGTGIVYWYMYTSYE